MGKEALMDKIKKDEMNYGNDLFTGQFLSFDIVERFFNDDDPANNQNWIPTEDLLIELPRHEQPEEEMSDYDWEMDDEAMVHAQDQIAAGLEDSWLVQRYRAILEQQGANEHIAGVSDLKLRERPLHESRPQSTSGARYGRRLDWDESEWAHYFRRWHYERRGTGIQRDPRWKQEAGGGKRGRKTHRVIPFWELSEVA